MVKSPSANLAGRNPLFRISEESRKIKKKPSRVVPNKKPSHKNQDPGILPPPPAKFYFPPIPPPPVLYGLFFPGTTGIGPNFEGIRKPQAPATFLHKRSSYFSGSSFNGNPAPAMETQMALYELVSTSTSYTQMVNVIAELAMNTPEQAAPPPTATSTQTASISEEQWLPWLNRGDPMSFMPTPGLNRPSGSLPATSGIQGSSPPPSDVPPKSPPPPEM